MKLRLAIVGLGTSALTALSACGNGPPPGDSGGTGTASGGSGPVTLASTGPAVKTVQETDDLKFVPSSVSVKAGDTVEFDNVGGIGHNVTFDNNGPLTPTMGQGDKAYFKFTAAGSYHYVCTIHGASMDGTITVA